MESSAQVTPTGTFGCWTWSLAANVEPLPHVEGQRLDVRGPVPLLCHTLHHQAQDGPVYKARGEDRQGDTQVQGPALHTAGPYDLGQSISLLQGSVPLSAKP